MIIYVLSAQEFDKYSSEDARVSDAFYRDFKARMQAEADKQGYMIEVHAPQPHGYTCFAVYPEDEQFEASL